jgi:hypothetical protein
VVGDDAERLAERERDLGGEVSNSSSTSARTRIGCPKPCNALGEHI